MTMRRIGLIAGGYQTRQALARRQLAEASMTAAEASNVHAVGESSGLTQ